MLRRERGFLALSAAPRRTRKPQEIAEICKTCKGKCKAETGLTPCPGREKYNETTF